MAVQLIMRDGAAEYAVLPWDEYQALLRAAKAHAGSEEEDAGPVAALPSLKQLQPLRELRGLSQEQVARAVGISPAYLAMIEQGERQPDAAICRGLALALEQPGWSDSP